MKLNLGCGADFRAGWLNVDVRPLYPEGAEFLCCDLLALDSHVADESVEEVAACNVLEFLPWREVDSVLATLGKKLVRRGTMFVQALDLTLVVRAHAGGELSDQEAQRLIFGAQGIPQETHRSMWTVSRAEHRLRMIGLEVERHEHRGRQLLVWARRAS